MFIAVVSHILWYEPGSVLTAGDWTHMATGTVADSWKSYGAWDGSGLGGVYIQIPFNVFFWMWSLVAHLGGDYDSATKITFFVPISLMLFVSPFVLLRYQGFSAPSSFIGAVFYGSNLYAISNVPPIQFVYALAPLLLFLLFRALASEQRSAGKWLIFAVAYSLGIAYEVRIMYVVSIMLVFAAVWFHHRDLVRQYRQVALTGIVIVALNSFWILPTLLGGGVGAVSAVAGRGLFGGGLFDITSAFAIFPWYWTGGVPNIDFVKQPVGWFYLLIPLVAFFSLIKLKQDIDKRRQLVMFYAVVALLGVFLTKESGMPLPALYQWLYLHVPGFSLFREASKFYLITAMGYAGLLAGAFDGQWLKNRARMKKWAPVLGCMFILILGAISYYPAYTGTIESLFISAKENPDYVKFDSFVEKQPQFFRTLWLPAESRWGVFSATHPKVTAQSLSEGAWSDLVSYNPHLSSGENYASLITSKYSEAAASYSSIKYIIVPETEVLPQDNPISLYGVERSFYVSKLGAVPWLKRINMGFGNLAVFENKSFQPHISALAEGTMLTKLTDPGLNFSLMKPPARITITAENPTKEWVQITGITNPFILSFAERFNSGWNLYLHPVAQTSSCKPASIYKTPEVLVAPLTYTLQRNEGYATVARKFGIDYAALLAFNHVDQTTPTVAGTKVLIPPVIAHDTWRGEVVECQSHLHFMDPSDLTALVRKSAFANTHMELDGYANGWTIDPAYIKAHYSKQYYRENPDGSIDINMDIYYEPQSYFYIGLGISGATLLGCMGYVGYDWRRRRQVKRSAASPYEFPRNSV